MGVSSAGRETIVRVTGGMKALDSAYVIRRNLASGIGPTDLVAGKLRLGGMYLC